MIARFYVEQRPDFAAKIKRMSKKALSVEIESLGGTVRHSQRQGEKTILAL
jgi:hypothetical protein